MRKLFILNLLFAFTSCVAISQAPTEPTGNPTNLSSPSYETDWLKARKGLAIPNRDPNSFTPKYTGTQTLWQDTVWTWNGTAWILPPGTSSGGGGESGPDSLDGQRPF